MVCVMAFDDFCTERHCGDTRCVGLGVVREAYGHCWEVVHNLLHRSQPHEFRRSRVEIGRVQKGVIHPIGVQYFCRFLKLLDKKVSADWICSQTPATRIENVNSVIKAIETGNTPDKFFASAVFNVKLSDLAPILQEDIYKKRYSKYLMLKLDLLYHGSDTLFQPQSTISIEHILIGVINGL